jgi:hypothetical protein
MTAAGAIARLKITLDNVEPKVLRRVEVPLALRLDRLHLVIQAAMGWQNYHLYEIRARCAAWGEPDPDELSDGPLDAKKARLLDVLEDASVKSFKYLYDFGDDWEHTVNVEKLADPIPGVLYPLLLEAEGRCPPEDCGGPWGYAEFLEALSDRKHKRHKEMVGWIGGGFDPGDVEAEALAIDIEALAKRWSRRPSVRRKA